ncbi:MAG: M20/M25/M40 family metallo-hydrolase [Chitinophagaceae bacterium]
MKKLLLAIVLLPFIGVSQNSDSIFIKKMSDDILLNGKAYDWLHHLTKKIGNRISGSLAFAKAMDWGNKTMNEAGADNVILQECKVPHWVRGNGDVIEIISINNQKQKHILHSIALGNSNGGTAKANVIAIKSFDELEKRKDEIKGKIVFFNYAFNQTYVETFNAYGDAGKYRYLGAAKAAKYGAVGCLVRSLSGSTDNLPHTGMMKYNDSFPKIPAAALGLQDADKLWDLCSKNQVIVSIKTHGKMMADAVAFNVIGELKGSTNTDEFITIGGHLDSWDVGEGAHDDGAGVVQTMEVLRVLKAMNYKPKHTIRFVLFANEENGLKGGIKYAEEAATKNEKHLFALETDGGGFTPRGFSLKLNNEQLKKVQSWIHLLQPYGTYKLEAGGGGADIGPLNEKLKTPVAELLPDSQRYFDLHHTENDVFENVNKRELLLGAVNMAALIYLVDKYGL